MAEVESQKSTVSWNARPYLATQLENMFSGGSRSYKSGRKFTFSSNLDLDLRLAHSWGIAEIDWRCTGASHTDSRQ